MVLIFFATEKLAKSSNDTKARMKTYGERAKTLQRRLDDLKAIPSLKEAYKLPGHLEPLHGTTVRYSMHLSAN